MTDATGPARDDRGAALQVAPGRTTAGREPGPPGTASTYVANGVRAEILKGGFRLGSRLDQQALAQRFGVSIIPVREALRLLEAEGLVRMLPRRGAFVAELSLRELTEISWIRERLEDLAVRLAAAHIDDSRLQEIEELNARMGATAELVRPAEWGALNREWHFKIYEASGAAYLLQLIGMLWDRTSLYREVLADNHAIRRASVEQHAEVARRLRAGDTSGAASAMRKHIRRGQRDMAAAEAGLGMGRDSAADFPM